MFWVISLYFNIRNTLPKSGTLLLGHSVYIYIKTLKTLLHVSITRSSSGSTLCSFSELLRYVNFGAVAAILRFLCVSRTLFRMSLVMVVCRVLCSVRLVMDYV